MSQGLQFCASKSKAREEVQEAQWKVIKQMRGNCIAGEGGEINFTKSFRRHLS